MNFFAILEGSAQIVKRIPLDSATQQELRTQFLEQRLQMMDNAERIPFDGRYSPDPDQLFYIEPYVPDDVISEACEDVLGAERLNLKTEKGRIKAVFGAEQSGGKTCCYFQVMDARRRLERGLTILQSTKNYTKLSEPGLVLQDHLAAIIEGRVLYFPSFWNARRFLDLNVYFDEATDDDIAGFAGHSILHVSDIDLLRSVADTTIRRKISLLEKNDVLDQIDTKKVSEKARDFEVEVTVRNGQIVLPGTKAELKRVLKFLDEDFFTAPLTQRKCVTNSKSYLS